MHSDKSSPEPSFEELARLKQAHRVELQRLPPDEAQAVVDAILHPRLWRAENPKQLAWPGDLADDEEGG